MSKAESLGYKVDFIAVHRYPDFTNPEAVQDMEKWLRNLHDKYQRPIWVTEFGAADVKEWNLPQKNTPNEALAMEFMERTVKTLEKLDFVERYAWFADTCDKEYALSAVFIKDGKSLTKLGKAYKEARPATQK